jgi:hypothetical protein
MTWLGGRQDRLVHKFLTRALHDALLNQCCPTDRNRRKIEKCSSLFCFAQFSIPPGCGGSRHPAVEGCNLQKRHSLAIARMLPRHGYQSDYFFAFIMLEYGSSSVMFRVSCFSNVSERASTSKCISLFLRRIENKTFFLCIVYYKVARVHFLLPLVFSLYSHTHNYLYDGRKGVDNSFRRRSSFSGDQYCIFPDRARQWRQKKFRSPLEFIAGPFSQLDTIATTSCRRLPCSNILYTR